MELHNGQGQRFYLNPQEWEAFREAAEQAPREIRTFCHVLLYTGCRISEVLELVPERIDYTDKVIVVRSLKKRNPKPQYRSIPVSPTLLDSLDMAHRILCTFVRKYTLSNFTG
jgi:integrase/recombinase XerD